MCWSLSAASSSRLHAWNTPHTVDVFVGLSQHRRRRTAGGPITEHTPPLHSRNIASPRLPSVSPPLSGCLRWVWCNWIGAVTLLEELQWVFKTLWYRRWTRPAGSAALVFYILQQKMKKLDVKIFMFSVLRSSHEVITETGQTLKCLQDRVLFFSSSRECRHDSTDASVSAECGHFSFIGLNTEIIHLFPVYHWVPWTQRGKSNDLMLYFLKDSLWDRVKLFIKQLEIILERGGCVIM